MTAIWSSTCKLRKPADGEEKGVGLGDDALGGVRASAGLRPSGLRVAPGSLGAGDQGENKARGGDDVPCVPTSLSCSNGMTTEVNICPMIIPVPRVRVSHRKAEEPARDREVVSHWQTKSLRHTAFPRMQRSDHRSHSNGAFHVAELFSSYYRICPF